MSSTVGRGTSTRRCLMPLSELSQVEQDRDHAARTLPCPSCGAIAGQVCSYGPYSNQNITHAGRYNTAAALGLVPPIPTGKEVPA